MSREPDRRTQHPGPAPCAPGSDALPSPLTIAEAAILLRSRSIAPVELLDIFLCRIEALDPVLRSFITLTAERAKAQAITAGDDIAAGRWRGPLHGIPYGLKDIYDTAGILTSGNSLVGADHVPTRDAAAVRRLDAQGAILLGKLATWEFAHGVPDPGMRWPSPRNPWHLDRSTSGSSSGPAAAVAAGLLPAALGSDTGGSIRGPASLTGVVGLKPTYGRVSRAGVIPNSFTFDHCGPLTWTVEDCAIVLSAIAGHDADDASSARRPVPDYRAGLGQGMRGLRVGVLRHFWEEDLALGDAVGATMEVSLQVLKDLGGHLENARIRPIQQYYDVKTVIAESEIFAVHQRHLADRIHDYGADFLARTIAGCLFTAVDYIQAQRLRSQMIAEMAGLYARFDVLVTCGMGPAPQADRPETVDYRNKWSRPNPYTPFNVLGGPALCVCSGFDDDGLPLALQIVGKPFDEETVLRVGYAYEKATPWRARRPALTGSVPAPALTQPFSPTLTVDVRTRSRVASLVERTGLCLPEPLLCLLCDIAPLAFAMADRIPRHGDWYAEPAAVFQFPAQQ